MIDFRKIALTDLAPNTGQIPGLPANPRGWTDSDIKRLAKSMKGTPELAEARGCIVVPYEGRYVVLGGNLRLSAAKFLKWPAIMCAVLPADTKVAKLEDRSVRLRSAPKLYAMVSEGIDAFKKQLSEKKALPVYEYPQHIITSAWVGALSRLGIEFSVPVAESESISGLTAQKEAGKAIFGKGYIVSDAVKAERERAEAERAPREKAAKVRQAEAAWERECAKLEKAERWDLSDRERAIIMRLNEQGRKATT